MSHSLAPELLRRPVRVLVVGCGGNGSAITAGLPALYQAMLVRGHCGGLDVTLMDGDMVSATNCVRQPFSHAEIGHSKAVVLVSRVNLFWGLNWHAVPEHFGAGASVDRVDILIGCVDSRAARGLIAEKVTGRRSSVSYWLDLGNHSTGGQFVLGQPWNWQNKRSGTRLRTVAELFPELTEPLLDNDGQPRCSAIEALEPSEERILEMKETIRRLATEGRLPSFEEFKAAMERTKLTMAGRDPLPAKTRPGKPGA